jgi:hypothetical protein
MATAYTSLLGFALPVTGELSGTWGDVVNNSITELVEDSIAGSATASVASGDWTLTTTGTGATNQARNAILIPTGSPGVSRNIIAPSSSKAYIVVNQSNAAVVVKGAATTGATVAAGTNALVAWNGSDFVLVAQNLANASGTLAVANGGTGLTTTPTNGQVDIGNGTGFTRATLTAGTGVSITNGAGSISIAAINNGTVTSVGGTGTVNGITLTGTVTTSGNLTLGGTLSGVSLSTQVTGTLPVANGGTGQTTYTDGQLLIGNTSGGTLAKATLTAGTGVSVTNGAGSITIANTGVTSVTGTAPVVSSGGSTPAISMPAATTSVDGYLTSTDWNTFNNKTSNTGTVTSVAATVPSFLSVSGSPVTTSGTLAISYSGTALPVANGGTGATTLTGLVVGNGTSAFTTTTAPSGTIVGTTDTQTLTNKRIDPRVVAASGTSGNLTIAGDTTDVYKAEGLTGAITFLQPSGTPVDGQKLMIRLEDNGTARAITWTTSAGAFRAVGITLPVTTTATKITYVGCVYNATDSFWDAVATVTQA